MDIIKNNPKPVLGYSDTTSIHLVLYTLDTQTYYEPSVLDGFAENVEMHKITKEGLETFCLLMKNNMLFKPKNEQVNF